MSTSNPTSLNAEAMTLAPRSCPSCPTLATRIRGRRPSLFENFYRMINEHRKIRGRREKREERDLDPLDDVGQFVLVFLVVEGVSIGPTDQSRIGDMTGEDIFQCLGDLSECTTCSSSVDTRFQEILLRRFVSSDVPQSIQALFHSAAVSIFLHVFDLLYLLFSHLFVVDLQHLDQFFFLQFVLVHSCSDAEREERRGEERRGERTNQRWFLCHRRSWLVSSLHILRSSVWAVQQRWPWPCPPSFPLRRSISSLRRRLDRSVFPSDRIPPTGRSPVQHRRRRRGSRAMCYFGNACFFLQNDLSISSDACTLHGRQGQGLVEGVGVQRLCSTEDGRKSFQSGSNNVVVGILSGERPARCLTMTSQHHRLSFLRREMFFHQRRPETTSSAQFGDFLLRNGSTSTSTTRRRDEERERERRTM